MPVDLGVDEGVAEVEFELDAGEAVELVAVPHAGVVEVEVDLRYASESLGEVVQLLELSLLTKDTD